MGQVIDMKYVSICLLNTWAYKDLETNCVSSNCRLRTLKCTLYHTSASYIHIQIVSTQISFIIIQRATKFIYYDLACGGKEVHGSFSMGQ